jgi:hypothetical protein
MSTHDQQHAELVALRRRMGRLEAIAWVERAVLAYLLYLSWDAVPEAALVVGGGALLFVLAVVFVERLRRPDPPTPG